MEPRKFISVQFTDIFWEMILKEGYRVFILYEKDDGEQHWTQSNTFHASAQLAYMEVLEIMEDGIIDMEDGRQNNIFRIVICHFPINTDRRAVVIGSSNGQRTEQES